MHGAGCHRGLSLSRPPPPSVSSPPSPPTPLCPLWWQRTIEHQKLFQEDNGLPVHLKGGAMDSALYHFTTLICTCYSLWSLAQASRPKKN
uniref:Cytochrome c oxidase subunit 7A1, mitochondrial n=1 Tax=Accipiter nisus TaxID=211598 RepID=A0A8B9MKE6_9AVES